MSSATEPTLRPPSPLLLAGRFLLPLPGRDDEAAPEWARAGRWLVVWGLLIGIVYAAVFRLAWRWFGEYQYIRFVPVACLLAVDLGWGGYRLLASGAEVASRAGRPAPAGAVNLPGVLAVVLLAILKYALLLSLPIGARPSEVLDWGRWRMNLRPLYPAPIYRPLVLMPLWGRWAMMLGLSIGRASETSSARLARMAGGVRLRTIMLWWLLCSGLTLFYAGESARYLARGTAISLGLMVAAYLLSFVLSLRSGGQTEATVGATGLAAEFVFLALYVASDIYWY